MISTLFSLLRISPPLYRQSTIQLAKSTFNQVSTHASSPQFLIQSRHASFTRTLNKYKTKYVRPNNPKIISRWIPMPDGNFIRKKSGTKPKHGRHERGWKRARARRLVLANPSQRRLLKKLVPHFKDTRRTYGGVDVYTEWGHLVKA